MLGLLILILGAMVADAPPAFSGSGYVDATPSLFGGALMIVALVVMALSVPGLIGGLGIINRRSWARILIIVLGFLSAVSAAAGLIGEAYVGALVNAAYAGFVLVVLFQSRYAAEFR